MVKPSGSIHWRRTKPPGWGGFFIGMVGSPSVAILPKQSFRGDASMIVEIFYVERIAVSETKDHSPVSPDKEVPEVTANGMAQVEQLFSKLDSGQKAVQ
jgi:hypothetical protein